jgi:hypothetical protein
MFCATCKRLEVVTIIGESEAIAASKTVLKLASSFGEYATSRLLIVTTLSNHYVLVRERGETIHQLFEIHGSPLWWSNFLLVRCIQLPLHGSAEI